MLEQIFQYVEKEEFTDVKLASEKNPSSDPESKIFMGKMSTMERFHNSNFSEVKKNC